jgi:hypothetical protein
VMGREFLAQNQDQSLYSWFQLPDQPSENDIKRIDRAETIVNKLLKMNPKSVDALRDVIGGAEGGRLEKHFMNLWMNLFPPTENGMKHAVRVIGSLILHPAKGYLKALSRILIDQRNILRAFPAIKGGVWRQIQLIHESLAPGFTGAIPASLEVCRFATSKSFVFGQGANRLPAIQEYLEQIEVLQKQRDSQVRKLFMSRLSNIASEAHLSKGGASNALTQLSGILQALKSQESLESGIGIWRELQSKIVTCFPIWLCRKQAVSFLFPCKEKIFDLVIVDEATQCRVDDALPLMYRARKVMVVGDDKQTVLAKNSVIDDYLFAEFNLDEHLRTTQARGIKGGGSHIFGLVKGIKEGGVMLDEHYRCPPAIIEYSNKYVYNSELKVMQWKKDSEANSVKIDWSEKDQPASARPDNGPYKAIEIDMVDRFFLFMEKKIKEIEKVTGARLNLEQDVAICYFLLKNEPYIKAKKSEFLAKMDRGSDVLDGAGAALQGKERPYIFYFWDISRSNMMAFRQGDDPDKRKGELNVLMSRPKKMAFHFLHKNFDELDHDKASITDFLWKAWNRQEEGEIKGVYAPRLKPPGPAFIPWKRSSGHLLVSILDYQSKIVSGLGSDIKARAQTSIVVGDSRYKVDVAVHRGKSSVALVDICGFDWHENCSGDVVDYFFQLKRAEPRLEPVFVFIHELADARSKAFVRLLQKLAGEI